MKCVLEHLLEDGRRWEAGDISVQKSELWHLAPQNWSLKNQFNSVQEKKRVMSEMSGDENRFFQWRNLGKKTC